MNGIRYTAAIDVACPRHDVPPGVYCLSALLCPARCAEAARVTREANRLARRSRS